jgi:hypothetical protein
MLDMSGHYAGGDRQRRMSRIDQSFGMCTVGGTYIWNPGAGGSRGDGLAPGTLNSILEQSG